MSETKPNSGNLVMRATIVYVSSLRARGACRHRVRAATLCAGVSSHRVCVCHFVCVVLAATV